MATLRQLLRSQKTSPRASSSPVRLQELVYNSSTREFLVEATSSGKRNYTLVMLFYPLEFQERSGGIFRQAAEDEETAERVYIEKVSYSTEVKVRCSCPDFRFTFSYPNKEQEVLAGRNFPKYQRKTQERPARTSSSPGLCKHLLSLVKRLEDSGYIKL